MFDALFAGLDLLFGWPAFGLMVLGVLSGLFIALIPGIGAISLLSVVVPFTYTMEPVAALSLFIGYVAVACTSDSIPAILMGIPGSASSQATVIDGYAMARNGQAAQALGASFTSSILGGLFGAMILTLMIPVIRPLVLSFGAPEFLVLALWGISMVAVLSGSSGIKGLVVGLLGLLLGAVGSDAVNGFPRWTFGQAFLLEGISIGLVGLGLFAVPELVSLTVRRSQISSVPLTRALLRGQIQGAKQAIRNHRLLVQSSALGTLIGAIPGIGSAVADWLAYGLTVQTTRDKPRFGQGDVRGVIGVDAANNATYGGALIPTVGFGVPGSLSMAFFLAVLIAQGIRPGPDLLTRELPLVALLIWGLAIANVIGGLVCFVGANQLARLTRVQYFYLFGILLPTLFLAAYVDGNSLVNLAILSLLGVFGYVLKQLGWPRPPLLLGVVLSTVVEANLSISVNVFGYAWLYRPIVLLVAGFIVLTILATRRWNRTQHRHEEAAGGQQAVHPPGGRHDTVIQRFKSANLGFALFLLAVVTAGLVLAMQWPAAVRRYPMVIGSATILCLLAFLVRELRPARPSAVVHGHHYDIPADVLDHPGAVTIRAAQAFAWLVGLYVGILVVGLAPALLLFTFGYLKVVGGVHWRTAALASLCLGAFLWLFGTLYGILWHQGWLARWFLG